VLVYRELDVRWRDGLRRRSSRRAMDDEERGVLEALLERVPSAVAEWSEGNAELDPFRIALVDRVMDTLSPSGGGRWWVAPEDCRPELDSLAPPGSVDAVIAVWPSDGTIPLCGWGCSVGPSRAANGAGFSSIVNDHWRGYATQPHPEEGFVHEWLHQVEATYRSLGVDEAVMPPLHAVEGRTSCCRHPGGRIPSTSARPAPGSPGTAT
jgi:hypothetical protein